MRGAARGCAERALRSRRGRCARRASGRAPGELRLPAGNHLVRIKPCAGPSADAAYTFPRAARLAWSCRSMPRTAAHDSSSAAKSAQRARAHRRTRSVGARGRHARDAVPRPVPGSARATSRRKPLSLGCASSSRAGPGRCRATCSMRYAATCAAACWRTASRAFGATGAATICSDWATLLRRSHHLDVLAARARP